MAESSPSGSTSSRNPDRANADCASESDPEYETAESAADRWTRELEALARRVDPVPEAVRDAARRALKARRDPPAADR